MFFKTDDLKNSTIFTRKQLCLKPPFDKFAPTQLISANIAKTLRTAFIIEHR